MQTHTAPKRLDTRHLANHARRAITQRLRYSAPDALLGVERDGDAVIIRVNSGGNALAVESYLRQRGYCAANQGFNPDRYGGAVKVTVKRDDQEAAVKAAGQQEDKTDG